MKHLNVLIFVLFFLINCTTEVDYNSDLTNRGSLTYKIGSDEPFTGVATKNGPTVQLKFAGILKLGKLSVIKNGMKMVHG